MSYIGNTDMSFGEEQAMLLDVANQFCREQSPVSTVRAQLDSDTGFDADLWQQMVELGWCGISLPEAYGGAGLGMSAVVPVLESMGRSLLATPLLSTTLAAQLLLRSADSSACETFLPAIASGEVATVAWLENPDWGDTEITSVIDDSGLLHGAKVHVADAAVARWLLVPARREGQVVLAVVETSELAPEAIVPHTLIDETRRAATVHFDAIKPLTLVATEALAQSMGDVPLLGALLVAAEATGTSAACLDTTVEYLKTRKQFGKLIGSYQALKHPCVDILNNLESSRSFVYHAASLITDGPLEHDAEVACRMAKAQATDTLLHASDRAVQFHGGMGFTYECDAQLYIRRAQWSRQQFGDALHHRKRLAALLLD